MKYLVNKEKYTVYQLCDKRNQYIAVPKEFTEIISNAITEYGNIKDIPCSKKIKGILLHKENNDFHLDADSELNEVVINELRIK